MPILPLAFMLIPDLSLVWGVNKNRDLALLARSLFCLCRSNCRNKFFSHPFYLSTLVSFSREEVTSTVANHAIWNSRRLTAFLSKALFTVPPYQAKIAVPSRSSRYRSPRRRDSRSTLHSLHREFPAIGP